MGQIEPPRTPWQIFCSGTLPAEIVHAICGVALVIAGGLTRNDAPGWFVVMVVVVGFAQLGASIVKVLATVKAENNEDQIHSLEGCLHTLHAFLMETVHDDTDPGIRITIHVPTKKGDELIQVLDYIGNQRATKTAGRRFKVQSGIIGLAYREGKVLCASRVKASHEEFVRELVTTWGYSESDARKINPATMSWLAVPLCPAGKTKADAVVYVDSLLPGFLEQSERQALVATACDGIARFVDSR